jgi:hypothetical protein
MPLSREYLHSKYLRRPLCEIGEKRTSVLKTGDSTCCYRAAEKVFKYCYKES